MYNAQNFRCCDSELNNFLFEITPKSLMMRTELSLNFPIKTLDVPKTWNKHLSKIYICSEVYLYYREMCDSEEISQFHIHFIRAYTKN